MSVSVGDCGKFLDFTDQDVRVIAYLHWLDEGKPEGTELGDWLWATDEASRVARLLFAECIDSQIDKENP